MNEKYLDDAHALALKAWRTHFPLGYLKPDDAFVKVIREALVASRGTEPAQEVDRYPFYDPDKQTLVWKDAQGNVLERSFKDGAWGEKWIIKEATRTEPAREES